MKKVLVVATVVKLHIMVFHIPYLEWLKKNGYEVHVAARNDYDNKEECNIPFCDKFYDLPFERSPLRKNNYYVYKKLKDIINKNEYDLIHCHTPVGGALGRLAAIEGRKHGTKSFYTAHGFHFYNGAPLINWLVYYPVEKWLARYTDTLITINKEDYDRAKRKFKAKRVEYIPSVGLDIDRFKNVVVDRRDKRQELSLPEDAFVILSVGELNKNKNHEVIIRAIAKIDNPDIHYVICGKGPLESYLNKLVAELGVGKNVHLLGFRLDIPEICKISDLFAFPSYREGLGMAALEAMACGLPLITSNVHGIVDYSIDGETGYNCSPTDVDSFSKYIKTLYLDIDKRNQMAAKNIEAVKKFNQFNVLNLMEQIYI